MASNKTPTKNFLYIGIVLAVIGVILMGVGTTTVTYQHEVFTVNGMTLGTPQITVNYFWNFVGLAIFLFGIGAILSHFELSKKGVKG
ncbi:hypothetical protein [Saccharolobus caldissimus]|uniref:Uncharacterized protein n=1 Tax=Saccharolobus caldissimus TaxID=1702097 RepID=A0AAQ4CUL2_9CREN|nr:hypothetical protein [Saccharolobus caldissimus]BDB99493.1 hypothetical protein SACC_25100 [Saccharolobus caldissimus]